MELIINISPNGKLIVNQGNSLITYDNFIDAKKSCKENNEQCWILNIFWTLLIKEKLNRF